MTVKKRTLDAVSRGVESGSQYVWVTQLSECWFSEPTDEEIYHHDELRSARSERNEIDRILLEALLFRPDMKLRRALLYDVASDAGMRKQAGRANPIEAHRHIAASLRAWKSDLARTVAQFDDGSAATPLAITRAKLSVQLVVLGRITTPSDLDRKIQTGQLDGCFHSNENTVPEIWSSLPTISMLGDGRLPPEDADPLSAIRLVDLSEYRRR